MAERVAVSHRVGERWVGEPAPRYPPAIVRFDRVAADGAATLIPGAAGADPAGLFVVTHGGSLQVVFQSWNRNYLELPPAKFEEYLRQEGLEWALAERTRRGEAQSNSREVFSRSAKAWVCGSPMPSAVSDAAPGPVGLTLEIVPEREPCLVRAGEELPVRLLFRGAPLAGLLVIALRPDDAANPVTARTDREGRVRLRLAGAGRWMVKTVHLERVAPEGGQWDWESYWSSLTLELRP